MLTTALTGLAVVVGAAAQYALQSNLTGSGFLDQFDFWNSWDPTYGFVQYVDRPTAESLAMVNTTGHVRFGADAKEILDPFGNLGRKSVRLTSKHTWTHGLFILDLVHMPSSTCGIWPAFWMLGSGPLLWPTYGEIDIIEFTNDATTNLMALHTAPNCTIAGAGQTGTLLTNDCGEDQGYKGCNISPAQPNSAGTDFNANGGGIYALEWTSVAIRIWFFPRNNIPAAVTSLNPDPSTWGLPAANYEGSCSIDSYFSNASLLFNVDFCGTWAGPTFNTNTSCPVLNATNQWTSCNMYVAGNPQVFSEAYWEVKYLNVFQATAGAPAPAPSPLSSVTPAESSTAVSAGGAEGRSTTTTLATSTTTTPPAVTSSALVGSSPSPWPDSQASGSNSTPEGSSILSTSIRSSTSSMPMVTITTEVVATTVVVTETPSAGDGRHRISVVPSVQTLYEHRTLHG